MKRLWVLGLVLAACGGDNATGPGAAGVSVLAGPSRIDTAGAYPDQLMVVQVRDLAGRPAANVEVVFTPSAASASHARVYSVYPSRTTDGAGRLTTRLRYGPVAGMADLEIAVPSIEVATSLRYEVLPGRPVSLSVPVQVLMLGDSVRPAVRVVDRNGNETTSATTVGTVEGVAGVTGDGRLYGREVGTGTVRVTAGGMVRTLPVLVVPFGGLVGYRAGAGIQSLSLDGSNPVTLAVPSAAPAGIDFDPATMTLVYGDVGTRRIMVVDPATSSPRVLTGDAAFLAQRTPRIGSDGRSVYFFGERASESGMYRASLETGEVELVGDRFPESDVSPDGRRLVYARDGFLNLREADGSATALAVAGSDARWSPDGRSIAFITPARTVAVLDLQTRALRTFPDAKDARSVDWSPLNGWILAASDGGVHAIDVGRGRVVTAPLPHSAAVWHYLREG